MTHISTATDSSFETAYLRALASLGAGWFRLWEITDHVSAGVRHSEAVTQIVLEQLVSDESCRIAVRDNEDGSRSYRLRPLDEVIAVRAS